MTQKVAYSGVFKPDPGDFGDYSTGDFSAYQEGHYYIKSDTLRSYPVCNSEEQFIVPNEFNCRLFFSVSVADQVQPDI